MVIIDISISYDKKICSPSSYVSSNNYWRLEIFVCQSKGKIRKKERKKQPLKTSVCQSKAETNQLANVYLRGEKLDSPSKHQQTHKNIADR